MRLEEAWERSGDREAPTGRSGLAAYSDARTAAVPSFWADHLIAPVRTIGAAAATTLKMSYWHSTIEDSPQVGDPSFLSASLRTSRATAWRDTSRSGVISMLPFEGAQWRFERPVSFMQFHLPFGVMEMVCGSLFGKALSHDDIHMPADVPDMPLHRSLERIRRVTSASEQNNLLLDSWVLILAEGFLRTLSSQGERVGRQSFGRLPARGIARVLDYIEDGLDRDLRLASLATIAGASPYHFARTFHETVGISPYAYVLIRRVARAQLLLRDRHLPLADIALACGFSSQSHFTTAFRRCLGVTPGEYRQRIQ